MNVADRIQHLRKSRGLSQEELADAVGVSRQAVSKWESEQSVPDMDKIIALSDYFETTTDYLLKGIEPAPRSGHPLSATVLMVAGTVLNGTALLLAVVSWFECQELWSVGVGLIMMVVGCAVGLVGLLSSAPNKRRSFRLFVQVNAWIVSFIPLACLYNIICGLVGGFAPIAAPVPLIAGVGVLPWLGWWLAYGALGVAVDFMAARWGR